MPKTHTLAQKGKEAAIQCLAIIQKLEYGLKEANTFCDRLKRTPINSHEQLTHYLESIDKMMANCNLSLEKKKSDCYREYDIFHNWPPTYRAEARKEYKDALAGWEEKFKTTSAQLKALFERTKQNLKKSLLSAKAEDKPSTKAKKGCGFFDVPVGPSPDENTGPIQADEHCLRHAAKSMAASKHS